MMDPEVLGEVLADFLSLDHGYPLSAVSAYVEDMEQIEHIMRFADPVGAMVTMQRGAIPALPTAGEARNYIRQSEPNMGG